jgi:hypothetical protein
MNALRGEIDLSVFASPVVIAFLALVAIAVAFGIIVEALNYRAIVSDFSGVLCSRPRAVYLISLANLYKYIPPGGVMYAAGRNRLALENENLSHAKVALATATEAALAVLAAVTVVSILVFDYAREFLRQAQVQNIIIIAIISVVGAIAVLVFIFRKRIISFFKKMFENTHKVKFRNILNRYCVMLVLMASLSAMFAVVVRVMGQPMDFRLAVSVSGLYMLSWLIGFITPGAPSGIGVREVVLLMFLGGIVNESVLLSAIVVHRLLSILGDIIAHIIAMSYLALAKQRDIPATDF